MRGTIRPTTRGEAVGRAMSMIIAVPKPPKGAPADAGNRPINYRLDAGFNGGADPLAPHCASWSFGDRTPTSDCIGLVLWASGIDRLQPGYKGSRGEWLNCASLLDDAQGAARFCELASIVIARGGKVEPGDWLITRDHIGMIVRPDTTTNVVDGDHLVVDCSPRHGRAHAVDTGYPWSDACVVVKPKFYKVTP